MAAIDVAGARGTVTDPEAMYRALNGMEGTVAALDPRMVCGRDHLLSAARHAVRAFARGSNSSSNLGLETILYASGERQISRALSKMGVTEGAEGVALVIFDTAPEEVIGSLGMTRDDGLLECTVRKLLAYGISKEEMESVPGDLGADLVLERVAFVEMLKR